MVPSTTTTAERRTPRRPEAKAALRSSPLGLALAVIALGLLALLTLSIGQVVLSPDRVVSGLADPSSIDGRILFELRVPRLLTAMLSGCALGIAGLLMQSLFRNPLADPWSLGLMAGGQFGAALVITAGAMIGPSIFQIIKPLAAIGTVSGAILGTLGITLLLSVIARRVNAVTLLVLGLMLNFLAQGLISVMLHFTNRTQARVFASWNDATFAAVVWPDVAPLAIATFAGAASALLLAKSLDAIQLGDTYAASLGVDPIRLRRHALATTVLLTALVTAYCGPVAFVGLIAPHLARGLLGSFKATPLIVSSGVIGAGLAVAGDFIVHLPWREHFLHLNAVLAIVGAPIVINVLLRSRALRAGAG